MFSAGREAPGRCHDWLQLRASLLAGLAGRWWHPVGHCCHARGLCQPHVARRLSLQVTAGLEQGFPGVGCVCAIQAEGGGLISAPFQNESSSSAPSWGVNPSRMCRAVHGRNSCLTPATQLTPELWALINLFWEQDFICNCTCKERLEVL